MAVSILNFIKMMGIVQLYCNFTILSVRIWVYIKWCIRCRCYVTTMFHHLNPLSVTGENMHLITMLTDKYGSESVTIDHQAPRSASQNVSTFIVIRWSVVLWEGLSYGTLSFITSILFISAANHKDSVTVCCWQSTQCRDN